LHREYEGGQEALPPFDSGCTMGKLSPAQCAVIVEAITAVSPSVNYEEA